MAHILRKYISNRGSALFMVISTMTALIISCMAMYFTMVSARSAQYAVFSQMQATQTAVSIGEIVHKRLLEERGTSVGEIYTKLLDLQPGESITTDANGFMVLDPNVETGKSPVEIGAYSVTITCLQNDDDARLYDILVMSSVSGSRDATHRILDLSETTTPDPGDGEDGAGGDAELFAATGYIPNDAYIDGGYYLTNVFYDTQYTYMNVYGGSGENRIALDLYTGGDLMLGTDAMTVVHAASADAIKAEDVEKIGPVTWAIRGNFYPQLNSDFKMRGGSQVLVGGDFTFDSGNNSFAVKNSPYSGDVALDDHICVYVNGDLNYSGADIKTNIWFFVNGKITGVGNNQQSNARLFATERADQSELNTNMTVEDWPDSGTFEEELPDGTKRKVGLTYNEFLKMLSLKTATIEYYKWDLTKNTETSDTQTVDVKLDVTTGERTFIFSYDDTTDSAKYIKSKGGAENGVIGKAFIINSVNVHTGGDNNNAQTIIIDTGDDPNNIMTIKLADVTGNKEFSWFVEDGEPCLGGINNHKRLVLLRGRGTVLFDLPKGVTYQDAGYQVTAHVGWYLIEGGHIVMKDDGHLDYTGLEAQGKHSAEIVPYIHKTCGVGDGCDYSTSPSSAKCNQCQGALVKVTCSVHGDVNKYCQTCHPENNTRTNWCTNHVDKLVFEDFYDDLSADDKKWTTGKDGAIVYPTTNIMLVSCDESSDMRFSQTKDNQDIVNNEFFGFIYAPYVSYYAAGGAQAGGLIKLCGGMTVGDYDIRAVHAYIGCYPDKMPNELAGMAGGGSMADGKLTGITKSWKIDIGGYR